jgi:hypothetical protein
MFEPIKFRLKHPLTASTFACREVKGKPQEEAAAHEKHIPPVAVQAQHEQAARANPEQRASVRSGKPPVAATPKPRVLNDRPALPAKLQ